MDEKALRDQLSRALDWGEAHVDWKKALKGVPAKAQGTRPKGVPHSPWELLEHVRIATWDILEFSRDPNHKSPDWPSGYWPKQPKPPNAAAWQKSVKALDRDLKQMQQLVQDPNTGLLASIPGGSGQTLLREILLLADHNAYHLGQLVFVRRLLGCWPEK
ncbi:MAG TPA: DinB family protein [Candidatus Aquilonibacter sp.]|nr:DinB family protein [Candidatus Aquilonibacter sp.]